MNGLVDIGQPADEHHWLWQEPGGPQLYLLLCDGARVTLRSQQIRAMNLAWALRERLAERPCVAVVGGGGAGITFAAAAAHIGASVTLYEFASADAPAAGQLASSSTSGDLHLARRHCVPTGLSPSTAGLDNRHGPRRGD